MLLGCLSAEVPQSAEVLGWASPGQPPHCPSKAPHVLTVLDSGFIVAVVSGYALERGHQ